MIAEPIVIGIGGNLGSRAELLERFRSARDALAVIGRVRSAPLYATAPIGPAQPEFLNTALSLRAPDMQPPELIQTMLEIERMLGRVREQEARWGPRTIDLDVLVWGARTIRTPELEIPHPRLVERRFALAPLADLYPDFDVPGRGRVGELLAKVHTQTVSLIAESW